MPQVDFLELENGSIINDEKKDLISSTTVITENIILSIVKEDFDAAFVDYVIYSETYRNFGRLGIVWAEGTTPAINEVYSQDFNNIFDYEVSFDVREVGNNIEIVLSVPITTENWKFKAINMKL